MTPYQPNPDTPIDRILVSILQKRLKSITEEMSIAMSRTTRSPILCEAKDFVTGLYDFRGDMLEQKENLPILAFSLQPVCKYIIEYFGDDIHDGDVIFHNDVFSMGNQNNDVAVYKPIFFEGELVAWSAVKGHQADIGGNVRGSYNPRATEVWQEALRIPPVKVYDRGVLRKDVWDLIFANIRLDIVAEDMRAEIGSCVVGERGIHKILERYGREVFECHKEFLFDSTEQMMRTEIRSIPEGVYTGESYAYYDGKTDGLQVPHLRHHHRRGRLAHLRLHRHRPPDPGIRERHLLLQRLGRHPDAACRCSPPTSPTTGVWCARSPSSSPWAPS